MRLPGLPVIQSFPGHVNMQNYFTILSSIFVLGFCSRFVFSCRGLAAKQSTP